MRHSKTISTVMVVLFLLVMIFDSKTALSGASQGVQLCVATVIPSLFPFFVVSVLLTGMLSSVSLPFSDKLGRKLGVSSEGLSILLIGCLGGYPVGAQAVAQACQKGELSRQEGERMLAFCSNAGPAFLFGIGSILFPEKWICWLLWCIHLVAALIVAVLAPKTQNSSCSTASAIPLSPTAAMQRSVIAMAMVCGWIVLFRTIIAFLRRWFLWILPSNDSLLVTGLLELTNGCCDLEEISSVGLRMQFFSLFIGFGGLCVLFQTKAVLYGSGLRGQAYLPGKITQAAISHLLCVLIQPFLPEQIQAPSPIYRPFLALLICVTYRIYTIKIQKTGSISLKVGV